MKKIFGRATRPSGAANAHHGIQDASELNAESSAKAENGGKPEKGGRNKSRRGGIKKKHIKWLILGGILIAVVVVFITCNNQAQQASANNMAMQVSFTVLEYSELKNTISGTGTVESADKTNVYSTMNYTVQNILVEVGDKVQEGDVLLELDRASIEKQIKEKELAMENSEKSGSQSVKSARDTYESYKEGLDEGTNSSLISANSSVQTAYDNYQKAIRTYNDYEKTLKQGTNSSVSTQSNAVQNAEQAYLKAEQEYYAAQQAAAGGQTGGQAVIDATAAVAAAKTLVQAKEADLAKALQDLALLPNDVLLQADVTAAEAARQTAMDALAFAEKTLADLTKSDLQAAVATKRQAFDTAKRALQDAEAAYDTALQNANNTLRDYKIAIDTAYKSYETALASRTATEVAADNQLNAYKNSLETARINSGGDLADYQLEEMRKDLEKANITAPVSGTVTAVYATVGATGNGLLFVIEDTNNLIVDTSVKEYDIGSVREGLPVTIKSDATGDEVFSGRISSIAPTSNKNVQGKTDTTGDIKFATEVAVVSVGTPLRIGMSVRLEFIVEQAEQVLSVPYDAIYENAAGQTCVLAAYHVEGGKYRLKEIAVTTGMENDLDIAISGEGLEPGLRIINTPAGYADGQEIAMGNGTMGMALGGGGGQGNSGFVGGGGGGGVRIAVPRGG